MYLLKVCVYRIIRNVEAENHDDRNDEKNRERDRGRDCRKCVDRPVNLQCSPLRRVPHGRALWCLPDPVPVVRASYGCDESGAKYSGSSALLAADRYEIYPEIPSMHAHFLDTGLRYFRFTKEAGWWQPS